MGTEYQKHIQLNLLLGNDATYHAHMHTHCEILHIDKGYVEVTVDGKAYAANENDVIIIMPHQVHSFVSTHHNRIYKTFLSPSLMTAYAEKLKDYVPETPIIRIDKERVSALCKSILEYLLEEYEGIPNASCIRRIDIAVAKESITAKQLAKSYISLLLDNVQWKRKSVPRHDNVRNILEYCMNNYTSDISVERMSGDLNINPHTVTRIFSSVIKCGFRKYINNLRISDAVDMLLNTDMSISQIAADCGFDTIRTFNRVFLLENGVTPSEYRKHNRNRETD